MTEGVTAVATVMFRIRYELAGNTFDESGTDVLILAREDGTWRVVWRTQVPELGEVEESPNDPVARKETST